MNELVKIPYGQIRRAIVDIDERESGLYFAAHVGYYHYQDTDGNQWEEPTHKWYRCYELLALPGNAQPVTDAMMRHYQTQAAFDIYLDADEAQDERRLEREAYVASLYSDIKAALSDEPLTLELTPELAANVTASAHLQIVTVFHESMIDESEAAA